MARNQIWNKPLLDLCNSSKNLSPHHSKQQKTVFNLRIKIILFFENDETVLLFAIKRDNTLNLIKNRNNDIETSYLKIWYYQYDEKDKYI